MKTKMAVIAVILATLILGSFSIQQAYSNNLTVTNNQENMKPQNDATLNEIVSILIEQGVPVIESALVTFDEIGAGNIAQLVIQSQSDNNTALPNEILYIPIIARVVNLTRYQGVDIDGFSYTYRNKQGEYLFNGVEAVDTSALFDEFLMPYHIENGTLFSLIHFDDDKVELKINDFTVNKLGLRTIVFSYLAADDSTDPVDISELIDSTRQEVIKLNQDNQAQIAAYQIRIIDVKDEPLLIYEYDVVLQNEYWWQK